MNDLDICFASWLLRGDGPLDSDDPDLVECSIPGRWDQNRHPGRNGQGACRCRLLWLTSKNIPKNPDGIWVRLLVKQWHVLTMKFQQRPWGAVHAHWLRVPAAPCHHAKKWRRWPLVELWRTAQNQPAGCCAVSQVWKRHLGSSATKTMVKTADHSLDRNQLQPACWASPYLRLACSFFCTYLVTPKYIKYGFSSINS